MAEWNDGIVLSAYHAPECRSGPCVCELGRLRKELAEAQRERGRVRRLPAELCPYEACREANGCTQGHSGRSKQCEIYEAYQVLAAWVERAEAAEAREQAALRALRIIGWSEQEITDWLRTAEEVSKTLHKTP